MNGLSDNIIALIKKETPIVVGKRVKEIRNKKNITQSELAILTGKDRQYIYKIEKGIVTINISTLYIMCKALDVTLHFFFEDSSLSPE